MTLSCWKKPTNIIILFIYLCDRPNANCYCRNLPKSTQQPCNHVIWEFAHCMQFCNVIKYISDVEEKVLEFGTQIKNIKIKIRLSDFKKKIPVGVKGKLEWWLSFPLLLEWLRLLLLMLGKLSSMSFLSAMEDLPWINSADGNCKRTKIPVLLNINPASAFKPVHYHNIYLIIK